MTLSSHIRRIALIAVLGCAMLAGWTSAAAARPIDDPALPNVPTAVPPTSSSSDGGIPMLPIAFAAVVVLVAVGTGGYAFRARTNHRALA